MSEQLRDEMRRARRASGMVWARFASEAGFGEAYLRNVENGNRSVTVDVAAAYDRVLRTEGTFTDALHDTGLLGPAGVPWNQPETLSVLTHLLKGSNVDRRGLLSAGIALSVSASSWSKAVAPGGSDSAAAATTSGPALVAHVDDRLDHLRRLDDKIGSGDVLQLARSELSLIVRLIKSGRNDSATTRHLHTMASEAARQVAWAAFDQGCPGLAQRFFDGALRASAEAGDPISGAYALSFAAIQCYSTPGQGNRSVSLLETATEQVRRAGTPRMHAMLAARTARALSKVGDKRGCARQLHLALTALDKGRHDDDPRTLYWVSRGEIEMIAGSSALQLNDPRQALQHFEAAREEYPGDFEYPRTHAIYLARAAEAHLAMHDLDAAIATARHAATCLGSVDSARSSSELKGLRGQLSPHVAHPAVREFLEVG
ncbi:hypothetical protein SRB5_43920 [Streptomyces sp. RB5]|uniref:HTH cro/C1-type domain-containing protein n=1 Tax=Streptomyces smaragdinus TaxID=2585196 RepID=A0A7K0CL63_9ACTN|nr:helix-turn-helix transcriptional regulator [Streptomyces smaragdinus]MQY14230.1 hypothetical protein [Streptomyces smaragdinus]